MLKHSFELELPIGQRLTCGALTKRLEANQIVQPMSGDIPVTGRKGHGDHSLQFSRPVGLLATPHLKTSEFRFEIDISNEIKW